eukprot:TRINITY_DN4732_c0_g1_i1.p1 TRINITY_DN4732_c0_g1~~TRINITY_DN4732_c0_g1_i1.p1  ORF type:complete len:304 (-),score=103.24 TRINITY_DN4732_c0_g1_i1:54-965(-)
MFVILGWIFLILTVLFLLPQLIIALIAPAQSARRKMMIASWSSPKEGNIHGVLECDMTNALEYIQKLREKTGKHITVTHVAIKAVALGLREAPSINGRIVLGRFVPFDSIDIGCLVAIEGGENLANAKLTKVDLRTIEEIADALAERAEKLRKGKDEDFNKANQLLKALPVFLIRPVIYWAGFLASQIGLNLPFLGVKPFPFGSCLLTSVGMMGLDLAFVPFTPFARVPLLVMIGALAKKAVVRNDEIVIREMLSITSTLDHRFVDGSQAAKLAKKVREVMENPEKFDVCESNKTDSSDKKNE